MTWTWDPKAERVTLGFSLGSFDQADDPIGLIHTTEGVSVAAAENAYRDGGYGPHVTFGPDPNRSKTATRHQHFPFTSRATTLSDDPGGIRPNRSGPVYQVEVVGFCDPAKKSSPWYIHNWPDWYRDQLAELMWDWEHNLHIPRRSIVTWRAYPGSYGRGASQRLSGAAFANYSGWLGHEHAPENSHGDPGDLNVADLFARMRKFDPPPEDHVTPQEIEKIAQRAAELVWKERLANPIAAEGAVPPFASSYLVGLANKMDVVKGDTAELDPFPAKVDELRKQVANMFTAVQELGKKVDDLANKLPQV